MPPDINKIIASAIEHISKFVFPLYVEDRSKPVLLGSAFFVELDDKLALVSAAHVLNQVSDSNRLFVYCGPNEVVPIAGKKYLSDPDGIDLGRTE